MDITVFGPGCANCEETERRVKEAVAARGLAADVRKVGDLKAMMAAGILATPGVAINGVVKSTGRIPAREEIAAWLDKAAQDE